MARRTTADPLRMLQAIQYIGSNGSVTKEQLFSFLSQFTDKEDRKRKKSISGATDDVLYNLKVLQIVTGTDDNLTLTSGTDNHQINLYAGKQVYSSYMDQDTVAAKQMIQTNSLFFSPEIRELAAYIVKKRNDVLKHDIGYQYEGKVVYGHKFNSFTIDTALAQLERLEIVRKVKKMQNSSSEVLYSVEHLHNFIFTQLLIEEYEYLRQVDGTVQYAAIREHFSLKYNLSYADFDDRFTVLRTTLIPDLIKTGSYEKFSIDMKVARELNLHE